jgi:predicted nuclease of predicted toxin-antitoxin system
MSQRLFIELYLDEDVDILVADLVRGYGFVAETTRDAGKLQRTDVEQLEYAVSQQKTLLTHNRVDFEALATQYFESGKDHYGIILAARRSPYEIVRRLLLILNHIMWDEMRNQLRYI